MEVFTSSPDISTVRPNSSNPVCNDSYTHPPWIFTVIPVYIYTISALGIILNLLVLLVYLLHKKPCSAAEIYLSNMAASDLLLVLFLPFYGVYVSKEYLWTFGGPMCTIVTVLIVVNYNCSIYFLILVCADRYLALVHPLLQCKLHRRKYAKMSCVAVWCFGLLLNIPTLMCRQAVEWEPGNETTNNNYTCRWNCTTEVYMANEIVLGVVAFLIPLLFISFFTIQILRALKERPREGVSNQKSERKVTVLVLAVLLAFLICWLPFRIHKVVKLALHFELIEESCTVTMVMTVCEHFFVYFAFFNSDLNPILYVIVGKNFRKKMWQVLCGVRSARKSSMEITTRESLLSSQKLEVKTDNVKR